MGWEGAFIAKNDKAQTQTGKNGQGAPGIVRGSSQARNWELEVT
jgi:hypothetical protein